MLGNGSLTIDKLYGGKDDEEIFISNNTYDDRCFMFIYKRNSWR